MKLFNKLTGLALLGGVAALCSCGSGGANSDGASEAVVPSTLNNVTFNVLTSDGSSATFVFQSTGSTANLIFDTGTFTYTNDSLDDNFADTITLGEYEYNVLSDTTAELTFVAGAGASPTSTDPAAERFLDGAIGFASVDPATIYKFIITFIPTANGTQVGEASLLYEGGSGDFDIPTQSVATVSVAGAAIPAGYRGLISGLDPLYDPTDPAFVPAYSVLIPFTLDTKKIVFNGGTAQESEILFTRKGLTSFEETGIVTVAPTDPNAALDQQFYVYKRNADGSDTATLTIGTISSLVDGLGATTLTFSTAVTGVASGGSGTVPTGTFLVD